MAEPFLGEIRIFSFNYAPQGWAFCNGQLLPINQNQALFSLMGTTYGGNGQTNFAIPNLQGRVPIHFGDGIIQGQSAGSINHTLTVNELPAHTHTLNVTNGAQETLVPTNGFLANSAPSEFYSGSPDTAMFPGILSNAGGSQAHENRQPSLVLNFCVALQGIFPSQN